MIAQQNADDCATRAQHGGVRPWTPFRGRTGLTYVESDGGRQRQRHGTRNDNGPGRRATYTRKRFGKVQHDHDRTVVSLGRISRLAVVLVLLVLVFGVVLPGLEFVERDGVTMNIVTVMVVNQECVLAQNESRQHGQRSQRPRRTASE